MEEQVVSILVGTAGLSVSTLVAVYLGISRPLAASIETIRRIRILSFAAITIQGLHFTEELYTRFYQHFPVLLGLTAWPRDFFLYFNLICLAVWLLCSAMLGHESRAMTIPIWFLAVVSTLNGIVHPLLAIVVGGYFPGLFSSLPVGLMGIILIRLLFASTRVPRS